MEISIGRSDVAYPVLLQPVIEIQPDNQFGARSAALWGDRWDKTVGVAPAPHALYVLM